MIHFVFRRFNPIRATRGAGAAEVIINNGKSEKLLWMTLDDIKKNLKQFSASPGLLAAQAAYHAGVRVEPKT